MKLERRNLVEPVGVGVHGQLVFTEEELGVGTVRAGLKIGETIGPLLLIRLVQNS